MVVELERAVEVGVEGEDEDEDEDEGEGENESNLGLGLALEHECKLGPLEKTRRMLDRLKDPVQSTEMSDQTSSPNQSRQEGTIEHRHRHRRWSWYR